MRQESSSRTPVPPCYRWIFTMLTCGLFMVSCQAYVASKPSLFDINLVRIASQTQDHIDLVFSGDNPVETGSVCLQVIINTAGPGMLGMSTTKTTLPKGSKSNLTVRVMRFNRSPGAVMSRIDVSASLCRTNRVFYTREFSVNNGKIQLVSTSDSSRQVMFRPVTHQTWPYVYKDLRLKKYEDLDRLLVKWNNPREKDENGSPKLDRFRLAINTYAKNEPDMRSGIKQFSEWRTQEKHSAAAAISEAIYLVNYAWHLRGDSYDGPPDPLAEQMFLKRMNQAEQILLQSKDFAASNPLWYDTYMKIAVDTGKNFDFVNALYEEAIKKFPYYTRLYVDMAAFYAPGDPNSNKKDNWDDVDKLVKQAVAATVAQDGVSNYAWIYMHIDYQHGTTFHLFRDSRATWPEFRDSFMHLIKRYPSAENMNWLASFACEAGDKDTYLQMELKIDGHFLSQSWLPNYTHDVCDRMFLKGT